MGQSATRLAGAFSGEEGPAVAGRWAPREPLAAVIDLGTARGKRRPAAGGRGQHLRTVEER